MYERLTKWEVDGCASVNGCSPLDNDMAKAINRLCEIEDKIEQGKIVELPCAVGTSVWFATCVCDEIGKEKYDALEGEVVSFSMQKYGFWVYCRYNCGLTYWHTIDGFKKEVFLTPEEANKKLTEIDELAKELCHTETCEIKKAGIPCNHRCKAHIYATRAVDKGYVKASEVAEEIFAEIEDVLNNIGYFDELDFEALKKKYIGKDTNVTTKETEDN